MKQNLHVVYEDKMWAVKLENSTRASHVVKTQAEAIQLARSLAIKNGLELIIHGIDGKIRQKNSYGNDPYPPIG